MLSVCLFVCLDFKVQNPTTQRNIYNSLGILIKMIFIHTFNFLGQNLKVSSQHFSETRTRGYLPHPAQLLAREYK